MGLGVVGVGPVGVLGVRVGAGERVGTEDRVGAGARVGVAPPPGTGALRTLEPDEARRGGVPLGVASPPRAARSLRATGGSTVEDAERANSPISLSFSRTCLLSSPNSLASSYTRTLDTVLLSWPGVCAEPSVVGGRHDWEVIGGSSQSPDPRRTNGCVLARCCTTWTTGPVDSGPETRNARGKARRRSASSRHSARGCT